MGKGCDGQLIHEIGQGLIADLLQVLGKYHPHGDSSVYDALVRMAQDFSMQYPLVDGQGNFGSVDGDPGAAMRYTDCRLRTLAEDMLLADLGSNAVGYFAFDQSMEEDEMHGFKEDECLFTGIGARWYLLQVQYESSFDGTNKEPTVLPARLPNLLLNGGEGIGVRYKTRFPPHNLTEVANGLCAYIDNPDISVPELMKHIKAPDFPTGGTIIGLDGVMEAYETGHGSFELRGKTHIEETTSHRLALVITELPYQVKKAELVEKIASLIENRVLDGVRTVQDESNWEGMRVVLKLARLANPDIVRFRLYEHTSLQVSFLCNMLTMENGIAERAGLKAYLQRFVDFRVECVERRTRHKQGAAMEDLHIVQGSLVVARSRDAIVTLILGSKDPEVNTQALMANHGLSQAQAKSILRMPLEEISALEEEHLEAKAAQLEALITDLQGILADRSCVLALIQSEARELVRKYGGWSRRTDIAPADEEGMSELALTPDDVNIVVVSQTGCIKRLPGDTFPTQHLHTYGKTAFPGQPTAVLSQMFVARNHDIIMFFSAQGKAYALRGYKVPAASRTTAGTPLNAVLSRLDPDDVITAALPVRSFPPDHFLVMLTRSGVVKRTPLDAFQNMRASGLVAIELDPGDQLLSVQLAREGDSIVVASCAGRLVHFRLDEEQLHASQRSARGVQSMKLEGGTSVAGMGVVRKHACDVIPDRGLGGPWVLVVTAAGKGQRVSLDEFPLRNRNLVGRVAIKV
eukprot:jgi/Mesvir1/24733/Mv21997-RA.1